MHQVERESLSAPAKLIADLGDRLPYTQFYRFCQLLEQSQPEQPVIGSGWQVRDEPVRFRPHPGMGFPASEIKRLEPPAQPHLPPSVRVTFMGLYGVESPLPSHYIDDITLQREGSEATADFLDIFNHRLIAQFYRIWRKYSYPATFKPGGKDRTSQYLLGLAGLGIEGCAENIATPTSRFLALLPVMLLPGRTSEGLASLVSLLAPETRAQVWHHDPRRIPLKKTLAMSVHHPVSLKDRPVMGMYGTDINHQVLMRLTSSNPYEVMKWLPGGELHRDLMALLHVYLGGRLDVRLQLCIPRSLLQDARLDSQASYHGAQLGRTAVMRPLNSATTRQRETMTINLGRYERVQENFHPRETDEDGDYRW